MHVYILVFCSQTNVNEKYKKKKERNEYNEKKWKKIKDKK